MFASPVLFAVVDGNLLERLDVPPRLHHHVNSFSDRAGNEVDRRVTGVIHESSPIAISLGTDDCPHGSIIRLGFEL